MYSSPSLGFIRILSFWAVALRYCHIFWGQYIYRNPTSNVHYVNPVELTAELLNTLIEKITVHEAVKGEDGSREQEVEIYYRFIGKID